jgi:hypothetical protein
VAADGSARRASESFCHPASYQSAFEFRGFGFLLEVMLRNCATTQQTLNDLQLSYQRGRLLHQIASLYKSIAFCLVTLRFVSSEIPSNC